MMAFTYCTVCQALNTDHMAGGNSLNSEISFQTKLNSQKIFLFKVCPNILYHFCPCCGLNLANN